MLLEVNCEKFRQKNISFKEGLNVVLGDEIATNSIGKSTLLMIIDFVFGGNGFLEHNADAITELGHHEYQFCFTFDGEKYFFKRGTYRPSLVYICDEKYVEKEPIDINDYTAYLKKNYYIPCEYLSFRACVGLFSRIWGKDNLNVQKALHYFGSQSGSDVIDNTIKIFDRYEGIRNLVDQLKLKSEENTALRNAFKNNIIPKISKTKYKENRLSINDAQSQIEDIKNNLAKYATNLNEIFNSELLALKNEKDLLLSTKFKIDSKLARLKINLTDSKYIKSKNLKGLEKFFPQINIERVMSIEEFHSGISKILTNEMHLSEKQLMEQLSIINREIEIIDNKLSSTLTNVKKPEAIIDRVCKAFEKLKDADQENNYYDSGSELKKAVKVLRDNIKTERLSATKLISDIINDKIKKIVTEVYGEDRKSPVLTLGDSNYTYEIIGDTGTGKAYINLLILDLSIFSLTTVPFLIHDSILYKNIENKAVANIIKIYGTMKKQSFIAIDEIEKYGPDAAQTLKANKAIELNNEKILFIKDWRKTKPLS